MYIPHRSSIPTHDRSKALFDHQTQNQILIMPPLRYHEDSQPMKSLLPPVKYCNNNKLHCLNTNYI